MDRNAVVSSHPLMEETTVIPSLPFEVVEEILTKLPVKFLMQLRSVCKSWKSLISDPKFAKKHLRVSTTRHHVLITYDTNFSRDLVVVDYPFSSVFTELTVASGKQLDFPLTNGKPFDYIVGSCHGIICFELDEKIAILWNPSIRKFTKLPSSLDNPKQEYSYAHFGFGYVYDRFNDNYIYKVVAVNRFDEFDGMKYKTITQVKVYTFDTNSWRMIEDFPCRIHFLGPGLGTFVSGTVNWLIYNDSFASRVIVSLDLDKESYREIMQPDYGVEIVGIRTLAVLRDCLCILASGGTFLDVWLMDEYGNAESWTKLFRISYSCMTDYKSSPYIKPLYLSEDDRLLLECKSECPSEGYSELAIYNSRDGTFKITEIQNINGSMVYQESLISPCS